MSDSEIQIYPEDILNAIDVDKINKNEKKRRGRPKKTQIITSNIKNKTFFSDDVKSEEEEIILHLKISKEDIKSLGINSTEINDINEKDILSSENENTSTEKDNEISDVNIKQYIYIIKKLKDENDELKKYLTEITPMYFTTVVKIYPIELNLFDMKNNVVVPKKTNLCCWWCTYQFDCLPTYLPEKYSNNKFYVIGCFCSFNCVGAYNINLNDNKVWERYSLIKQLYYMINKDKITNITDIEINIAGPKELLEKFGGPMTITDYRKNSKILGREYHKLIPPFLPITIGFEEITNNKNSKNIGIHSLINSKTDNITIKRNKPLNIESKNIDNYIE
jgi:hypothetical protein